MRKLKDLPEEYESLKYARIIDENDFYIINNGLSAVNMEDKWIVSKNENTVSFHRSWTRYCIYTFNISEKDNMKCIENVKVNNNQNEYKFTNHSEELELFSDILELFLSKKLSGHYQNSSG